MKKLFTLVIVLILAGCASPTTKIAGEVVSCTSIQSAVTKDSIELDCLDGASSASINSIKGPAIINVWGSWCGPCKEESYCRLL